MNQLCRMNAAILTSTEKKMISNEIFSRKKLHILHLNINSLLPKIDEIRFINSQMLQRLELVHPN